MVKNCILIWLTLLLCTCKKDDDIYTLGNAKGSSVGEVIRITNVSPGTLEADTLDTSVIDFLVTQQSDPSNRTITLSTTLGNFLNGNKTMTITADATGKAQAIIRSSSPGDALVTATVKSISIDTVVHFKPAFPDDILLTADSYSVDTSSSINLTATISRNPGRGLPSDPNKVWFTVTPGSAATALVYPTFATTNNHVATVAITNPFKVIGTFKVEAKTVADNADTIRKYITLVIK